MNLDKYGFVTELTSLTIDLPGCWLVPCICVIRKKSSFEVKLQNCTINGALVRTV